MGFNGIVLSCVGFILAVMIYAMMTNPQLRRPQYRGEAFSKRSSAGCAIVFFLVLVGVALLFD